MGSMRDWFVSSQAVLSMLLVQLFSTGLQLFSRVVLEQGTFIFALLTYRFIVGTLCVAPFAFYFERGHAKKLSWRVWFWLFLNALAGITVAMGLFYYGLRDTSATYSTNFLNLVPIFTFFVSVICRMEKLGLKTWAGKAKSVGAILCVGGALITSLYKGKAFHLDHHNHHSHSTYSTEAHKTNMLRGTLFLVGSCFSYTAWYIVQVKLLKELPLKYWATMLTCILASVQTTVIGLCIDSNKEKWALGWNLQLITIIYSGAFATAAAFCLISRAVELKGPIYPPMFYPLALIFVAFSEAIFLGEPLTVGILVGMVLIIFGLYSFLWGKRSEIQNLPQPNVAAGEVSTGMPAESTSLQLMVPPSSSPNNTDMRYPH